jgi:hypothetical protein
MIEHQNGRAPVQSEGQKRNHEHAESGKQDKRVSAVRFSPKLVQPTGRQRWRGGWRRLHFNRTGPIHKKRGLNCLARNEGKKQPPGRARGFSGVIGILLTIRRTNRFGQTAAPDRPERWPGNVSQAGDLP